MESNLLQMSNFKNMPTKIEQRNFYNEKPYRKQEIQPYDDSKSRGKFGAPSILDKQPKFLFFHVIVLLKAESTLKLLRLNKKLNGALMYDPFVMGCLSDQYSLLF